MSGSERTDHFRQTTHVFLIVSAVANLFSLYWRDPTMTTEQNTQPLQQQIEDFQRTRKTPPATKEAFAKGTQGLLASGLADPEHQTRGHRSRRCLTER
jgi:hypothetical protein